MTSEDYIASMRQEDGGLYNLGAYIYWKNGSSEIVLDGHFVIDDLEEIVKYIKSKQHTAQL